ncbi:MAG: hypothetical protein V7739_00105 [Motiliproteus sp.]
MDIPALSIAPALSPSPRLASSSAPAVQQQVALSLLQQANEFQGQLALQLLPQSSSSLLSSRLQTFSTVSPLGQLVDIQV